MRIKDLLESSNTLEKALHLALPIMKRELGLSTLPVIKLKSNINVGGQASFGLFKPLENIIFLTTKNRHPNDILRTLAHELTHYRQNLNNELQSHSGETGSDHENEANALAGKIMRIINKEFPSLLQ